MSLKDYTFSTYTDLYSSTYSMDYEGEEGEEDEKWVSGLLDFLICKATGEEGEEELFDEQKPISLYKPTALDNVTEYSGITKTSSFIDHTIPSIPDITSLTYETRSTTPRSDLTHDQKETYSLFADETLAGETNEKMTFSKTYSIPVGETEVLPEAMQTATAEMIPTVSDITSITTDSKFSTYRDEIPTTRSDAIVDSSDLPESKSPLPDTSLAAIEAPKELTNLVVDKMTDEERSKIEVEVKSSPKEITKSNPTLVVIDRMTEEERSKIEIKVITKEVSDINEEL